MNDVAKIRNIFETKKKKAGNFVDSAKTDGEEMPITADRRRNRSEVRHSACPGASAAGQALSICGHPTY